MNPPPGVFLRRLFTRRVILLLINTFNIKGDKHEGKSCDKSFEKGLELGMSMARNSCPGPGLRPLSTGFAASTDSLTYAEPMTSQSSSASAYSASRSPKSVKVPVYIRDNDKHIPVDDGYSDDGYDSDSNRDQFYKYNKYKKYYSDDHDRSLYDDG